MNQMRRVARSTLSLALTLLFLAKPDSAQAQSLPTEPFLRINAAGHIAAIKRIAVDAAERFAVTASDDKSVRVWSLPDGKLQHVIWLPAAPGDLGKAYAVALSPDGSTIAVGGWTSWTTSQPTEGIYLFERASGVLRKRLPGLANVVNHLAFSPDGKRLAAALGEPDGIRVFDAEHGYTPLPSDSAYEDDSYWVDFDHMDRLASASYDGFLRLYAPGRYDSPGVPKTKVSGVVRPKAVAFSPDGRHVAVSDEDSPTVAVLGAADLTPEFRPDVTGDDATGLAVAWSQDGRHLFAGGVQESHSDRLARRWDDAGAGPFIDIAGASNTVMQFVPLSRQRMLFLDQSGFGIIDAAGKATRLQGMGSLDPRIAFPRLSIGMDAKTVQVRDRSGHLFRFDLLSRAITVDPPTNPALIEPVTSSAGVSLTDWENTRSPKLNGKQLTLRKEEMSRSIALVPGADRFVLGAEWSLRLFDASGRDVWPAFRAVPGVAWGVNVSADGKVIVAAYGDGTVRWHRTSDGEELLALFMDPDGKRWVLWTPQGYYDAAAGADDLIGWQVNHGYDQAPDFFPASQFRQRFNRRDVIARVLDTLDVDKAVAEANRLAGEPVAKAAPLATSLLTPVVQIKDPAAETEQTQRELAITYTARMTTSDPILRVAAKIDGASADTKDLELTTQGDTRVGQLRLTLPRHDSTVSVIAYNANGPSQPATLRVHWAGAGQDTKPTLYVLAIGVTNYKTEGLPKLSFPAKDAQDFVTWAKAQKGGLYDQVVLYPKHESLSDDTATHDDIIDGLDWIASAVHNSNDVAMIFLSGHGLNTADQHYRFLPYDYDPQHLQRTTIKDTDLREYIAAIGGKKIFFFDTCYSGNIVAAKGDKTSPDVDRFANELREASNGVVVFLSSKGNEFSLEKPEWHNGAFTKALVEGLRGQAARPDIKVVSIGELQTYIYRQVTTLTANQQHPVVAIPTTVEDYPIAAVP